MKIKRKVDLGQMNKHSCAQVDPSYLVKLGLRKPILDPHWLGEIIPFKKLIQLPSRLLLNNVVKQDTGNHPQADHNRHNFLETPTICYRNLRCPEKNCPCYENCIVADDSRHSSKFMMIKRYMSLIKTYSHLIEAKPVLSF